MTPDRHIYIFQITDLERTAKEIRKGTSQDLWFGEEPVITTAPSKVEARTRKPLLLSFSRNKHRHHSLESWPRGFLGGPFDVSFGTSSNKPFRPENEHIDSPSSYIYEVKSFLTKISFRLSSSCAVDSSKFHSVVLSEPSSVAADGGSFFRFCL